MTRLSQPNAIFAPPVPISCSAMRAIITPYHPRLTDSADRVRLLEFDHVILSMIPRTTFLEQQSQ